MGLYLRFRQFNASDAMSGAFLFLGSHLPRVRHNASPLGVPAWRSMWAFTSASIGSKPAISAIRAWSSGGHGRAPFFHPEIICLGTSSCVASA